MNIYSVIALLVLIVVVGHFFNLGPAIQEFATKLADIPSFDDKGSNPALFDLAVRFAYLIALVGVIKVIWSGRMKDE